MTNLPSGLDRLQKAVEGASGDFEKARWVKLGNGQNVGIQFLQEIDADSEGYNPDYGLAIIPLEHSNPHNYMAKGVCTLELEGRCYGCEQNAREPKTGWNARSRFYSNVLVDDGKEDPYVAILSQGVSDKSITPTLALVAANVGGITTSKFRIQRNGEGKKTSYTLIQMPGSKLETVDPSKLYDLEKVAVRVIPYVDQAAFYNGKQEEGKDESADTAGAATSGGSHLDW